MKSMSTTRPERRRARGFSLVTAIFILVALAALGAAILTVSTGQQLSATADLQGSRAYWAARSAADYGLMQLLRPEDTSGAASFADCMAVPQAVTYPGLGGLVVSITNCERSPAAGNYVDGALNIVVYTITASAVAGVVGSSTYVEREVTVSAAKCKDPNALMPDGSADARNRCT